MKLLNHAPFLTANRYIYNFLFYFGYIYSAIMLQEQTNNRCARYKYKGTVSCGSDDHDETNTPIPIRCNSVKLIQLAMRQLHEPKR